MKNFDHITFPDTVLVSELLSFFENSTCKTAIITDQSYKLKGAISEGDLRRYIIKFGRLPNNINHIINKRPKYISQTESDGGEVFMSDSLDQPIPVVSAEMKVVGIYYKSLIQNYSVPAHKKNFLVKSPARISFAGGGTDVSSWFKEKEGLVINSAINKFARIYFNVTDKKYIKISSLNLCYSYTFNLNETGSIKTYNPNKKQEHEFFLYQIFSKFSNLPGMEVEISCDFDPGSGLGGSSSVVTGLIKGITFILGEKLTPHKLANVSYETERYNCGIKGGWQDHITSSFGGFCALSFSKDSFKVRRIPMTEETKSLLNSCLFLVRVGASRSSSEIHESLSKSSENVRQIMKKILLNAKKVETIFTKENIANLASLMNDGWALKKRLSPLISNNEVDQLIERLLKYGATGARLLGAGRSGYILIYVPPEKILSFSMNCKKNDVILNALSLVDNGCSLIEL